MSFLETHFKEILSALTPLVTWTLSPYLKSRSKLLAASTHQFTFLVQVPLFDSNNKQISPTQTINTGTYIIRNVGREPAKKLEVVFNYSPMYLNIWPVRQHTTSILPDSRHVLIFESLAPGETIGFEILSINVPLPPLTHVRSEEGIAKNIAMLPQPVPRKSILIAIYSLMGIGLATIVYTTLLAAQYLFSR